MKYPVTKQQSSFLIWVLFLLILGTIILNFGEIFFESNATFTPPGG